LRHSIRKVIQYTPGETFYLKPFFDIHAGSTACDLAAFKRDLKNTCDNTYLFFGGDLFDSIVVTDKRYRKSGDASLSDAIIDENINEMADILKDYKHRIIGIGSGNHEDVIVKRYGTDPIGRLCKRLDIPAAGFSGLFKLSFTYNGGRGRTVIVRYHHGWGGGSRTQGADLTKFSKDMMHWEADVFLYGHVHRRQTDTVPRIGLVGDTLVSKPKLICNYPTYSEVKGYPPVEIGGCCISIKPETKWVKMKAFLD
jgi:hypothetical protein